MADKTEKTTSVSAKVSPDLYKFIDDLHWSKRVSRSSLVATAVLEFAKTAGYKGE